MSSEDSPHGCELPLAGCRVVEHARTVAAAYAGRLLAAMGATVVMLEPPEGSPLRAAPPLLGGTGHSALFAFLASGKRSLVCDLMSPEGQRMLERELASADILIDDTALGEREARRLDHETIAKRFPALVHVSVRPFGASGPKADWDGEEVNLLHAGGEGFLLPNGLCYELFPDRPPLKIYGYFSEYQGGSMAAFAALSAWWAVPDVGGQYVDVSVQDAVLAVGAFALQRLGDGSLEHRKHAAFPLRRSIRSPRRLRGAAHAGRSAMERAGGAAGSSGVGAGRCADDPLERSRRGDEINHHIREWMSTHAVDDIVRWAQQLGVPAAKYRTPAEVIEGEHERSRADSSLR